MSYKIEIQNNFFVVTDTATGIEEIREVRDEVKWRVSGSLYSFFYNIPNLVDQNSPNIIRLGENAKEFDFSEIVDSTETPFASREIFNTLLNENLGFIIRETSSVWGLITGDINDQTDLQTILNGKFDVPTGDTTQYIAGDGTLITFPVAGQAGTLVREVKNMTGATLTKGTIVYINGANGNKPTVAKALATSDATSAQTFGFLQSDIPNNSVGFAVAVGDLTGLDTSAITEGTQLYLSSTVAGEYTTTKQVAPAHLVYVGIVTRSHPTLGQIEVKIQNGYELDELHDVLISGETDGQVLQFEGASGLWKNKTLATGLTVGSTAISGGADGRVLFQNGGVVQESANLFWDNTNVRLGVGTSSPASRLDILAQGALSTDLALRVRNSANTADLFNVLGNGITNLISLVSSGGVYVNNSSNAILELNSGGGVNPKLSFSTANSGTATACGYMQGDGNGWLRLMGGTKLNIGTGTNFAMSIFSNLNVSVNTSSDLGAKLGVLAQGALSTDIVFKVRNSANTIDILKIAGNGNLSYNASGGGITLLNNDGTTDIGSTGGSVTRVNLLSGPIVNIYLNPSGTNGAVFNSARGGLSAETAYLFNAKVGSLAGSTNYGKVINIQDQSSGNRANTVVGLLIQKDSANTNTLLNFQALSATSGNVGVGVLINNASAKVQIDSTTQGFLPPRMTNAQRTAIATPAVGLMVYCTDATEGLYIYKSTGWTFVI